jgi:hypothetical protein
MKKVTITKDYDDTWSFTVHTKLGINNVYGGYMTAGQALDDAIEFYSNHIVVEISDVDYTATP